MTGKSAGPGHLVRLGDADAQLVVTALRHYARERADAPGERGRCEQLANTIASGCGVDSSTVDAVPHRPPPPTGTLTTDGGSRHE